MNCKQLNTRTIKVSSSLVQDKKQFYVGQKKCPKTLTVLVGALLVVVITPAHEKISGIANIMHFGIYWCEVGLTAEMSQQVWASPCGRRLRIAQLAMWSSLKGFTGLLLPRSCW